MTSTVAGISRDELYSDPQVRRLLALILTLPEGVSPKREPNGEYHYPQVDEILGTTPTETVNILNQLANARILEKEVTRTETICPVCRSGQLQTRLECPLCGTNDLRKTDGVYQCVSCSETFTKPLLLLECESCGKITSTESLDLKPLYAFKMNPTLRESILETCTVEIPVSKRLIAAGFTATCPAVVQGKLGNHTVDILAKADGKTWIVNVLNLGREGNVDDVTEITAATMDIKPDKSVIIAIPRLSREAKRLVELFHVQVIEGQDIREAVSEIEKSLQARMCSPSLRGAHRGRSFSGKLRNRTASA